ncbi:glycosyl transferase family 2 [Cellulophaga algicola DSM 14237]|uniref:Glycosyl transferase family 2 n=1 Tax=Cellulophaga algicola (strain DSM 14237 / IC166 / ACAM 630) TaxID=688270 RepID=E6XB33_CELAD|nr:glycosyltransferase family 2 protein [Cellulophaga algicola]ADV48889.1 glycosyl transferase family 2 [Cellulophaga algicola DSM 14237]
MNSLKVNIILVNYNTVPDTIECLESILKQDYKNYQVFLIDNSSKEKTIEELESWCKGDYMENIETNFPEYVYPLKTGSIPFISITENELVGNKKCEEKIILVKANKNDGFAAANNIALNHLNRNSIEEHICWLLNNDTVISPYSIGSLVDFYFLKEKPGIIGTSLMEYSDKTKIQAIGGLYNSISSKLRVPIDAEEFYASKQIKYPNGASMIVSKEYLNIVGSISEEYFLYFEELDWILKGRMKGFSPAFLVQELVYHKGGASTGKNSELADYYYLRGRLLVTLKFFKKYSLIVFAISLIMFPLNRILIGQIARIKILFKVFADLFGWLKGNELRKFRG